MSNFGTILKVLANGCMPLVSAFINTGPLLEATLQYIRRMNCKHEPKLKYHPINYFQKKVAHSNTNVVQANIIIYKWTSLQAINIAQSILNHVTNPDNLSSLIMTGIIKRETILPRVSF